MSDDLNRARFATHRAELSTGATLAYLREGTEQSNAERIKMGGAAIEVSQSRKGLHLWGMGAVGEHSMKCTSLGLEFYTEKRFIALTGEMLGGDARTDHTPAIASLVASCFPPRVAAEAADWTDGPCAEWNGPRMMTT